MRTKTSKDLKKVSLESDHKICLSVPKVVLDASDCAKLLDGTGKTSVIVMERDGKMVAVSRSSSSSSTSEPSIPCNTSSTSLKSLTSSSTRSSLLESVPVEPAMESGNPLKCSKISSSLLLSSPSTTLQKNNKTEIADLKETTTAMAIVSTVNHAQDSIPSDQGKMILKPPKKRRVNDSELYGDTTANLLMNGDGGHSVMPTVPFVAEAREAVALRSTPTCPVISTPSSSLQKHTIENLLQSSSSNNNNNNNNDNNNSSSSSNMNLISGLPYPPHQTYVPIIHPPIHQPISGHELCSPSSTISPLAAPVLPASSSSSLSLLPSLSSSHHSSSTYMSSSPAPPHAITTSSIPPDPSPHLDSDPSVAYNHSHHPHHPHPHQLSQLPPVPIAVIPDQIPSDDYPSRPPTSSQLSPTPSTPLPSYRTSPEQEEPINLSTATPSSKPISTSSESEQFSNDHNGFPDNHSLSVKCQPEDHSVSELSGHLPQDVFCVNHSVVLPQQISNSESSYADAKGFNELHDRNIMDDSDRVSSEDTTCEVQSDQNTSQKEVLAISSVCENSSDKSKLEILNCSSLPFVENSQNEKAEEKSKMLSLSQNGEDSAMTEVDTVISQGEHLDVVSSKDVSPPPENSVLPKKSKKSSKKKAEIPMDEKSCAMRSSSYSESIDHVIQHFEYVEKQLDNDIELTEEEEAILRQQFDDSAGGSNKTVSNNDIDNKTGNSISDDMEMEDKSKYDFEPGQETTTPSKGKSKGPLKGVSKPKKKRIEKLSPIMQNVVDVLSFVATNVGDETCPTESGLVDLEAFLKSLKSKCQKRISQLGEENDSSCEKVTNAKMMLGVKKAERTLSDISLFYPTSGEDLMEEGDESKQLETSNDTKDNTNAILKESVDEAPQSKSKKSVKRKSDNKSRSKLSNRQNCESDLNSTDKNDATPKKIKKTNISPSKSKIKHDTQSVKPNLSSVPCMSDSSSLIGLPNGEYQSQATSDIGESIASTSAGSDEQWTPVHEPNTKDEGVNTDLDGDAQETEDQEDLTNKPVRHYKKRLDFVKCSQCDHQCRGQSALSRHMKKIHLVEADMPYRCHLCTYGCTKMASLNRHLYTHNVFPCSRCDFQADEREKLTQHMADTHKDKLDMKLCKVCSRYIKCDGFTIEDHSENCKGPTPFKCKECSKEFKYASSLRVHHHTHFPDEPKLFKCERCDYRTNYKANLHKHHKNMHDVQQREIPCPECGKKFSSQDNMRRHRKVHTSTLPFSCETCKKSFKTAYSLKGHQLIHTATRSFICSLPGCSRSFRTSKFLKSHQEEFHGLAPKKYACLVEGCHYSFFKRSHLKRHAITHTGERNYHCAWPNCRKSFRHADNLKVHFRAHSMESIQCPLCDFKCKHRMSLFKHKQHVHKVFDASVVVAPSKRNGVTDVEHDKTVNDARAEGKDDVVGNDDKEVMSLTTQDEPGNAVDDSTKVSIPTVTPDKSVVHKAKKSSVGSMDMYEFKSDGESEEEGPSPLRWDSVKSASTSTTPLPPPPKELLLKNEKMEKKEKEKLVRAEKKELMKKEKADKKELEKKEKAEKRELEKKEKLEKKELEKKEKEEKREQDKRDRKEQKEKERKEKEELKEKDRKEKEEQKEREKKEKEEQKEKEKREKEDQKEKEKLKKKEEKEKEKEDRLARKAKLKKDRERKKNEVKRLKAEAKRVLQKRTTRFGRGMTRKASLLALKSKSAKGKRAVFRKRKSPSRAASPKGVEEKKTVKAEEKKTVKAEEKKNVKVEEKKTVKAEEKKTVKVEEKKTVKAEDKKMVKVEEKKTKAEDKKLGKVKSDEKKSGKVKADEKKLVKGRRKLQSPVEIETVDNKKRKGRSSNKLSAIEEREKAPSRSASPRAASPRGGGNKSPARESSKTSTTKGPKKKSTSLPKRKRSTRIKKASQKSQPKAVKKSVSVVGLKKSVKNVVKKAVKGGRRGRPVKKKVGECNEGSDEKEDEGGEEEGEVTQDEVIDNDDDGKVDDKFNEASKKTDAAVAENVKEDSGEANEMSKVKSSQDKSKAPSSPCPSSSEEDMLQGKASPYRDFSDAEDLDQQEQQQEDEDEAAADKIRPSSSESCHEDDEEQIQSPRVVQSPLKNLAEDEEEGDTPCLEKMENEELREQGNDQAETSYHGEEDSSEDEGINDIPLTPPRAPAPPPVESSEDELEPPDTMDSSAPYSTPAPNTPYSNPAPNTPYSNPAPNTPYSNPASNTPYSNPAPNTPYSNPAPNTPYSNPAPNTPYSVQAPNTPFSVPGPTTPFSVPPPTNLVQQHSVHSEDIPSSLDLPSVGSVEMQQPQGSVESSHPIGSVEVHRNSSEMSHHNNPSVEMTHHNSSLEMSHHNNSVEMSHHNSSVEMSHHNSSVEMSHQNNSVEMSHHNNSVEMSHHSSSVEMSHHNPSVEMSHHNPSVEMSHHNPSVEMSHHNPSVEMSHHNPSVEMSHHNPSVEMSHHNPSVEMSHHNPSVEMSHHNPSVEMSHHNPSVEMSHHNSVELIHHRTSTEMSQHSSVEMHPHSVEIHPRAPVEIHSHRNSTEMRHPHAPVDIPAHDLMALHGVPSSELHSHGTVDMHTHSHHESGSTLVHSHTSQSHHTPEEIHHPVPQSLSQAETAVPAHVHAPPGLPHPLAPSVMEEEGEGNTSEADKRYFDQYLKNLSAARSGNLLGSPESSSRGDIVSKSPVNPLQSSVATSVITSMDSSMTSLYPGQADLRRLEAMVGERQLPADPLYARDTMSAALSRQNTTTPLLPTNHATPTPTFDAFPSLNPLHSSAARDNASSYLRQQENLFATPPVTSSFMAEAMFQRQSMTTPFLPPHPHAPTHPHPQTPDRAGLSRIQDPTGTLRTNNTSSLLRRPTTMPTTADMFAAPTVPQTVPRHPLTNAWSGQEVRPTHWQNPYFPRQTNMASAAANNPFFPAKENYLPGRDLMFDPSTVRSQTERGMFSSQDPLQLERFDLSNFFPSAVTPYGSSSSTLDYSRPSHTATPKPFDDRYRQTAAAAASAGLPDFRGLPTPTSAAADRFPGIGVNPGFNLYPTNPTMPPYHPQHVTDNMNSAFLSHPSSAQHAMLERDYAAAAAHRGLYPHHPHPHHHQNTPYPFIDDRQYSGSAKLAHHAHNPPTTVAQERDLMGRSAASQDTPTMQDPYRSVLYRY